jgi:hypothetical protein
MIRCAYSECGVLFEPKTHNQRYHTSECCRMATNNRIMENYYERKARRQGHIRVCATEGCTTKLSRYNDEKICAKCTAGLNSTDRDILMRMLNGA